MASSPPTLLIGLSVARSVVRLSIMVPPLTGLVVSPAGLAGVPVWALAQAARNSAAVIPIAPKARALPAPRRNWRRDHSLLSRSKKWDEPLTLLSSSFNWRVLLQTLGATQRPGT